MTTKDQVASSYNEMESSTGFDEIAAYASQDYSGHQNDSELPMESSGTKIVWHQKTKGETDSKRFTYL